MTVPPPPKKKLSQDFTLFDNLYYSFASSYVDEILVWLRNLIPRNAEISL